MRLLVKNYICLNYFESLTNISVLMENRNIFKIPNQNIKIESLVFTQT